MNFEEQYDLFKLEDPTLINNPEITAFLDRIRANPILPAHPRSYPSKPSIEGKLDFSYLPHHQDPGKNPELTQLVKYIEERILSCSERIINDKGVEVKWISSWTITTYKDTLESIHNHACHGTAIFYYDIPKYKGPEDGGRFVLANNGKMKTFEREYKPEDLYYVPVEAGDLIVTPGWIFHAPEVQNIDGPRTVLVFDFLLNSTDDFLLEVAA